MNSIDSQASLPLDEDGYLRRFSPETATEAQAFLQRFGFVALDALAPARCDATLHAFLEKARGAGVDPERPATWARFFAHQRFGRMGIVGLLPDLYDLEQLRNRVDPGVYAAFAAVLGREDLWVDHDRLGIMPPTVDPAGDPTGASSTLERWLHLDCNPVCAGEHHGYASIAGFGDDGGAIDFANTTILQGLLALTDAREEDGGFHCVPGSHHIALDWVKARRHEAWVRREHVQVPVTDPLQSDVVEVPLRKGSLLVWTSLLFHANHPNRSPRLRAVQYIRMLPTTGTPYRPLMPDPRSYPPQIAETPLAGKLLGLKPWERPST